jgi:hypothetical protein
MSRPLRLARIGILIAALTSAAPGLAAAAVDQLAGHPEIAGQVGRPVPLVGRSAQVIAGASTSSIQYDDGEADNGYGPGAGSSAFFDVVMRFDLPRAGMTVDQVSPCFQRLGSDDEIEFDITFWEPDGPDGGPGTLIDFVRAIASGVPEGLNGGLFTYDLTDLDIQVPGNQVYVGVGWDAALDADFFACVDEDRPTVQPGYLDLDQQGDWADLTGQFPDYTALILRGVFSDDVATGPCVADDFTLCLNQDRFQVRADWATESDAGAGHAQLLTDDTGYFWFFNSDNVEMVVKVLDACQPPFDRFWVFAGGLTDVEVTLTVTDTQTGVTHPPYFNPLRTPFQPIQDTSAFATCP